MGRAGGRLAALPSIPSGLSGRPSRARAEGAERMRRGGGDVLLAQAAVTTIAELGALQGLPAILGAVTLDALVRLLKQPLLAVRPRCEGGRVVYAALWGTRSTHTGPLPSASGLLQCHAVGCFVAAMRCLRRPNAEGCRTARRSRARGARTWPASSCSSGVRPTRPLRLRAIASADGLMPLLFALA